MADEPTYPPSDQAPVVPSGDTPLPTQEVPAETGSVRKKAIISTAVVTLLAIGMIAFDPFNFFKFDVDVSRDKAAEITPSPSATPTPAPSVRASCSNGRAVVTWEPIAGAKLNGLTRSTGSGPFTIIFLEARESNFSQYTFNDTTVQSGRIYQYRAYAGLPSESTDTATVTCQ